jgi:hypothetical protein
VRRGLLAALMCLFAYAAHAAPLPAGTANVSYTVWTVSDSSVLLKFLLPAPVAQSLTGAEVPLLTTRRLGDYILQHVDVEASGHACPAVDQGYDLGKVDPLAVGADMYGFEILFRCAGGTASGLALHNHAVFALSPGHIDFARIERSGRVVEQLFTAGRQRLPVGVQMSPAGFGSYVRLGAMHLSFGLDRLCFLLGSLLLIRGRSEAAYAFAALIAGYATSLLVVASGWVVPRPALLEAFMGLMVALLAALITLRELRRPRVALLGCPALLAALALVTALTHAHWAALALFGGAVFAGSLLEASAGVGQSWLLPMGVVGFLDGFALPSALVPLNLPMRSQLWMTVGFDAGAVVLAALVMGVPLGVYVLVRERIARLNPRAWVNELAAACLGGLGTFWLVSRLYT